MKILTNKYLNSFLAFILYLYYKIALPNVTNKRGRAKRDADLLITLPRKSILKSFSLLAKTKSQLRQDWMVLTLSKFKEGGYFVEFGATNGKTLSNTWILEKYFSWTGILAEPAKIWHKDLFSNRTCHIETDCVWSESNQKLSFNEVSEPEISTITLFNALDEHQHKRKIGKTYEVNTISLNDLLEKYAAPSIIDFLSIDTEGSEYKILSEFDFSRYQINIICCEHNHTSMRDQIHSLLTQKGFVRRYEHLSEIDDWYFSNKFLTRNKTPI